MRIIAFLLISFLCQTFKLFAQDPQLVMDKVGTYKLVNWTLYSCSDCKYTKTEQTDNWKEVTELAEIFHQSPILQGLKGFETKVVLYHDYIGPEKVKYGISGDMSIQFCAYFKDKTNKIYAQTIEPPDFDIIFNELFSGMCGSMGFRGSEPTETPTNPNYNKQKWQDAAQRSSLYISTPGKKETIMPGVDRYADETLVIYNENQPAYWEPATIKEVFESWMDYYRYGPDQIESQMTLTILEQQYAQFTEEEKNQKAYFGARGDIPLLTIDTKENEIQILKLNENYWDKSKPKSDIQIMFFNRLKDTNRYEKQAEEALKYQGGGHYLNLFLASLNVEMFKQLHDFIVVK